MMSLLISYLLLLDLNVKLHEVKKRCSEEINSLENLLPLRKTTLVSITEAKHQRGLYGCAYIPKTQ